MNEGFEPASLQDLNIRLRELEARLAEFERKHTLDAVRADRTQEVRRHNAEIKQTSEASKSPLQSFTLPATA